MFDTLKRLLTPKRQAPKDLVTESLDLMSGFGMALDKNEMAQLLSVSPEKLKAFEERYKKELMDFNTEDGAYFDKSLAQLKDASTALDTFAELESIIDRIVDGLLAQTTTYDVTQGILGSTTFQTKPGRVTKEELMSIPEELRPQLTDELIWKDVPGDSCDVLLFIYRKYLEEQDPAMKAHYYGMFRSGVDFMDLDEITYRILSQNPNTIGNWLPTIAEANQALTDAGKGFFKIPDTKWFQVPITLLELTRHDFDTLNPVTLQILDRYCKKAFNLQDDGDYFIKTGTASSKFDFRNARVTTPKEVNELGEYLCYIHGQAAQMAGPLNQPCGIYGMGTTNEWVVREFIKDTKALPCIYKGMPLRCEYRVFVDFDAKTVLGMSPYWRKDVMKQRFSKGSDKNSPHQQHDYVVYCASEKRLDKCYAENKDKVQTHIRELLNAATGLAGQWSLDIMQDGDDFYLIDMATADRSALNDCVPAGMLKTYLEQWLPKL